MIKIARLWKLELIYEVMESKGNPGRYINGRECNGPLQRLEVDHKCEVNENENEWK